LVEWMKRKLSGDKVMVDRRGLMLCSSGLINCWDDDAFNREDGCLYTFSCRKTYYTILNLVLCISRAEALRT
jgi:hypothetical protein